MNHEYVLGLSIHTTAVGWALTNQQTNAIIDSGVRLFNEADSEHNENRKFKRSLRRQYRRRKYRLRCVQSLFIKHNMFDHFDALQEELTTYYNKHHITPYDLRSKGLQEELSNIELYIAMYHLAKRRGDFHRVLEDEVLPIHKQIQLLHNSNGVRGRDNKYSNSQYIEEAYAILNHQDVSEQFKDEYLEIIARRRTYYDGPGNEKSNSLYKLQEVDENGIKKSMFLEKRRGIDFYDHHELRACKECYSVQLFKLLDELNKAVFDGRKLTRNEKSSIILYVRNQVPVTREYELRVSDIEKALNKTFIHVENVRLNYQEKPVFTNLLSYQRVRDICRKENQEQVLQDRGLIDELIETNTLYQKDEAMHLLKEEHPDWKESFIEKILRIEVHGFYYLSLQTINQILIPLWNEDSSADEILRKKGFHELYKSKYQQDKLQPVDMRETTSAMMRSYRQSLRIIKAIEKKYGIPKEIHIHVQRNQNQFQLQQYLIQKNKKKKLMMMQVQSFCRKHNIEEKLLSMRTKEKVKLYILQKGKCVYTGKSLDAHSMLVNPTYCEVDHIIPQFVSFDDSTNNKVLTFRELNHEKSNRTAMMYLKTKLDATGIQNYRKSVGAMFKRREITQKKLDYLLFDEDLHSVYVQKKLQNKLFQDHRKFAKQFQEHLHCFYEFHNLPVVIQQVHPNALAFLHRKLYMFKNSNHHQFYGEEAVLTAISSKENLSFLLSYSEVCRSLRSQIENFAYKFSRKIEKRYTGAISDDSFISLRKKEDCEVVIAKHILCDPNRSYQEFFAENGSCKDKILMAQHDEKTYLSLCEIYKNYHQRVYTICHNGVKNPFLAYELETGESIRKYAKKGNGPIITSFQYEKHEIHAYHDVSYKFEHLSSNKKIVLNEIRHCRIDAYQNRETKEYKIAVVTRMMCVIKGNGIQVQQHLYQEQLDIRGIDEMYHFLFSLYPGDIIKLHVQKRVYMGCLRGCVSIYSNRIKCTSLTHRQKEPDWRIIGPRTKELHKFTTDILGDLYEVHQETLKMSFPLHVQ